MNLPRTRLEHGLTQFCFPPLSRTLPFVSLRHIGTPPPSTECDLPRLEGIERGRGLMLTVRNPCLKLLMCIAFVAWELVQSYMSKKNLGVSFKKAPHCKASVPIGWGLMNPVSDATSAGWVGGNSIILLSFLKVDGNVWEENPREFLFRLLVPCLFLLTLWR